MLSHYHRINSAKLQAMAEQGASRLINFHLTMQFSENVLLTPRIAESTNKPDREGVETAKTLHFTSLHFTTLHYENKSARE